MSLSLQAAIAFPPPAPRRAPEMSVEVRRLQDLGDVEAAWRALFVEAIEPNPFLGPDFLLPLARLREGRRHAALVWRRTGGTRALVGLLPFLAEPGLPLVRPPVLRALADPFVANATPLVAGDGPGAIVSHLLAGLAQAYPGALLLVDPLRLDGPVAAAFRDSGQAGVLVRRDERAAVRGGTDAEAYLAARVPGKRVRELRRFEKRLAEAGRLETVTLWGAAAAPALDAFLELEAGGWKGRQGTALASRPRVLAFARKALAGTAPGIVADLMTVNGRPVAAAIHLVAGEEAVAFKCAYDEAWAKASPGALLDLQTLRTTLDSGRLALMDSGAQPGHPVEGLWRDRLAFGSLLVALRPETTREDLEGVARRLESLETLARSAKALVKRALGRKSTALRG
jgi:CelD/BcsL family acetyltransferase involved in cellulose biosynthesis